MKALWIADRVAPDRGGVAVAAERQLRALAPKLERLDVLRLAADLPPGRAEAVDRDGWTLYRVGRAREGDESLQLLAQTAANLLAARGHDLVHGFGAVHAGYVAVLAARQAGVRSAVSLRGNDVTRAMFHGPRLPFLGWTLERADALLAVTRELAATVRALVDRTDGVHHVPNGVDTALFRPDAPGALDELAGCPRPWLAFSGELRLKKGLPLLLDLAGRLAAEGRGTLVLLGGVRADERDGFARWRRGAGAAAARIREIEWTADPARRAAACAAMDAFVFPSLWDGMPNALLEAMAAARPVVASAVGGAPEVIRHGESGVLVPAHELGDFPAVALRTVDRPAADLARMGAAARARVCADFTVEAERDATLGVYAGIAAGRRG